MKKDFESRFMPNVKFLLPKSAEFGFWINFLAITKLHSIDNYIGFCTNAFGDSIYNGFEHIELFNNYKSVHKEVSIFEAIPELIPDGMRYNRTLDKLVPDVVSPSAEYCSGIKVEFGKVVDYVDQKENISCKNEKSKYYELWNDFEAIDVLKNCLTRDEFIGFLKGNILKYQLRLGKKDDVSKEMIKIKDYQNELNHILKELEKNAK